MAFSMTVSGMVTVNSRRPFLRRSRCRRTLDVLWLTGVRGLRGGNRHGVSGWLSGQTLFADYRLLVMERLWCDTRENSTLGFKGTQLSHLRAKPLIASAGSKSPGPTTHSRANGDFPSPFKKPRKGGLTRARFVFIEGVSESRRCFGAFISARKIPFHENGDCGSQRPVRICGYWAKVPSPRSLICLKARPEISAGERKCST
jgi:hypothetical protein